MKKKILIFIILLLIPVMVIAEPPAKPGDNRNNTNVSYKGASTLTSNDTLDNKKYSSSTGGENALIISNSEITISNSTVSKSGNESSENSDFYGTNAGILAYNNGVLIFNNGEIITNGTHANGVFAIGTGHIKINNSKITTTGNNSGGIMVTGNGKLDAKNLTVKTSGNSSAAIRSDRGGGTLTVEEGTYETSGMGSPSIYSTANISVKNATLLSNSSEGIVIEGSNSVSLDNVTLTDTNNTLNGNSETYKNIFLYQSMSGDADVGKSTFTAKDSTITTNKGDTFFVTNTTAEINLEGNAFTNTDGDFLRIQTGKWGKSGSNGGIVTLNATNQLINGNMIIDNISTLDLNLKGETKLTGAINSDNKAKKVTLSLEKNSIISLTNNTYVNSLENEDSDNNNIYSNGYKLYVDGKEIKTNEGTLKVEKDSGVKAEEGPSVLDIISSNIIIIIAIILVIIILIVLIILKKRKNDNKKVAF